MTNPPQDSDAQDGDRRPGADEPTATGASRVDPDRFATQPAPTVEPTPPTPAYGQPARSTASRATARPRSTASPSRRSTGRPRQPQYGQPTPQPAYGQPAQPGVRPARVRPAAAPVRDAAVRRAPVRHRGAPAEKSKVGLIALVTGGVLVLIAVVVVLVMSLQSTVLDPAAVERDVAAQFQEREGVSIELDCGDDMEVTEGATYECSGTTADGESVTLRIAITDEESAAYTWTEP